MVIITPISDKKKSTVPEPDTVLFGGDYRDRTGDLLHAMQALSRLVRLHTPLNRVKRALQYAGYYCFRNLNIIIAHKISSISRKILNEST
jgi:hypothetical protein